MKKIILITTLLLPGITYAGGSHYYQPIPSHDKQTSPPAVSTPIPTPSAPASVVTPTPAGNPTPSGGGTQIYCSSPTAPGYRVGVPNGGCPTPISTRTVTSVPLNALPYTGTPWWYIYAEAAVISLIVTTIIHVYRYKKI